MSIAAFKEAARSNAISIIDQAIVHETEAGKYIETLQKVKRIFANATNSSQMQTALSLLKRDEATIIEEERPARDAAEDAERDAAILVRDAERDGEGDEVLTRLRSSANAAYILAFRPPPAPPIIEARRGVEIAIETISSLTIIGGGAGEPATPFLSSRHGTLAATLAGAGDGSPMLATAAVGPSIETPAARSPE